MANTSATGGYLTPTLPPTEDTELDDVFHDLIVGLTGFADELVRPRWQPTNPKVPEPTENWCAFGISSQIPDDTAYQKQDNESTELQRSETIELLASIYGPLCRGYANVIRDGLQIAQNREAIRAAGFGFVECGPVRRVPEKVNDRWYDRCDVMITFNREILRTYEVLTFVAAQGELDTEILPPIPLTVTAPEE